MDRAKNILRELEVPAADANVHLWFNRSEEWRGLDWDAERDLVLQFATPEARDTALRDVEARRRFCAWKTELHGFLEKLWSSLEASCLLVDDHVSNDGDAATRRLNLMMELNRNAIVPNEDLEIVATALLHRASAFITCDAKVLSLGLSLNFNHKTAFVHPDRLDDALRDNFAYRWSPEQTRPRKGADG